MVLAHIISHDKRTQDIQITDDVTFDTMLLSEMTLSGLKGSGFYKPSPIQLHGVPLGKCGFDLLLEAKSGTGKTAVFAIIALEKLDLTKNIQTVILAPTREIAAQICDVIIQMGSSFKGLKVEVVMGGLPVQEDIQKFKNNVHIVVGSPGRLKHLIQDNHIDISLVRLLILDEADKLMEKSFQRDINYIFSVLPKQKQVIMSSATYPEYSKLFINKYVRNARHICPDSNSVLLGITQLVTLVKCNSYIVRQTQHRFEELLKILSRMQFKQCLIFCNYQARVGELHKMLTRNKWPAEQLYGQQEQTERLDALKTLQEYKCRILIATDLAARGIDASNIDLVINFEPPFEWQTYLHRIGRAGRFGSYGTAITILSEGKEQKQFQEILSAIKFPLNLKNMWTDEIFNNESVDLTAVEHKAITKQSLTTVRKKLINKKTSDELWCALTCDNFEIPGILQSFDKLHHSLEEFLDHKIDYFSTLLNSFNNYQPKTKEEGNKFNCLVWDSQTVNDNLAFVHSLKSINQSKLYHNKLCQSFYTSELCNEEVGLQSGYTSDFGYNIGKSCEENIKGEVHPNKKKPKTMSNQFRNSLTKFNDNENINVILDDHQLRLECLRATRKQYGAHFKTDNLCTYNNHGNSLKETELIRLHSDARKITSNEKSTKYLVQNQSSNPKFIKTARSIMKTYTDSRNTRNSFVPNPSAMEIIQIETVKRSLRRNNYFVWYSQLKAQMSQIELSAYFVEMKIWARETE